MGPFLGDMWVFGWFFFRKIERVCYHVHYRSRGGPPQKKKEIKSSCFSCWADTSMSCFSCKRTFKGSKSNLPSTLVEGVPHKTMQKFATSKKLPGTVHNQRSKMDDPANDWLGFVCLTWFLTDFYHGIHHNFEQKTVGIIFLEIFS